MNAKTGSILVRVSEDDKERIRAAAALTGKSATTFVLDAAAKEAARIEKHPPQRGVHRGVPSYFKGWCHTASKGGSFGYDDVGYELVSKLGGEMPYDIELEEWQSEIDALAELLCIGYEDRPDGPDVVEFGEQPQESAALEWFKRHYPKMMDLIPPRRRHQFMVGVYRAYDEEFLSI